MNDMIFIYKTKKGYEAFDRFEAMKTKATPEYKHVATIGALAWFNHFLNANKKERSESVKRLEG